MNFASDNVYGIHPRILAAIEAANKGTSASYGYDDYSKRAEEKLSQVFEKEVRAFLVTTGTAANGLALSALAPSYGAVLTHAEAHAAVDECNSPEMFTGGAKIIGLHGVEGKITPAVVATDAPSMIQSLRPFRSPIRPSSVVSIRLRRSRRSLPSPNPAR